MTALTCPRCAHPSDGPDNTHTGPDGQCRWRHGDLACKCRGVKVRAALLLALLIFAACGSTHQTQHDTTPATVKIVAGFPCYRPDQGGRIMQMDPNVARFLGGYTEVPCPR